ncbi:Rieske 2Fe-2S domain-containing protein [Oceanobacter sp. 5_MG-2023]|uniref:Rieske (2Fe-2S) protein n=1 Tax=Oceanobacter sp. 5_MG-2023 TaxID=3062645 RepID=UPI0026E19A14|nr:Rieske 2Fe-2S domain-containing protein [Oceanobacter sp. 5_MG-2023]MDO6683173.1 Rieske 2Fe-2S domain-containing protein [Oceanobacter sp. 5_MG-2023]
MTINTWRSVCATDAIAEGCSRGFELDDTALLIVRRAGQWFVFRNQCPHLGIRLEWVPDQFLDIDGHFIQCSTHGALFQVEDGRCIAGPCSGQYLTDVASTIRDGQLLVQLDG